MMRNPTLILPIIAIALAVGLSCCKKEIKQLPPIKGGKTLPLETALELTIIYSDSGLLKAKIYAPVLERYEGKEPYMLMPKGVKMEFFDGSESVNSTLTADFAKITELPDNKIMEARKNVVVVNENGETLKTEELFWNQKQERISSDVAVTITRKEEIIQGIGLESNQNFTRYKIKKIKGTMEVKND